MIKLFTGQFYAIESDVNEWLEENEEQNEDETMEIGNSCP